MDIAEVESNEIDNAGLVHLSKMPLDNLRRLNLGTKHMM